VSAKDKASGKKQSIIIKASSGLSSDEVERMIKDAEAHADEDRKLAQLVAARNQAEGLIHATEKALNDFGNQIGVDEKTRVELAIDELKAAIKDDDQVKIEARAKILSELSIELAERASGQAQGDVSGTQESSGRHAADSDAIDGDFEEIIGGRSHQGKHEESDQ